jgi:hypothetical protein
VTTHSPTTPDWTCRGCGQEWPCPTRRKELLAEYGEARVALSIYLGAFLVHASTDLRYVPAGWLHNRFVGWARELPCPTSAVDILLHGHELALSHVPDQRGQCPTCGDLAGCWVRLAPGGPGFFSPLP